MWVTVASSTVILWTMVYVQSTCGAITSSWDILGQPATDQLVTHDNHDQSNQQDDSRERLLMECHETVGSLRRDMEILQQSTAAACEERGDRSDIMDALRELQDDIQELKVENSNLRQTTTLLEEELASRNPEGNESKVLQEVQGAVEELRIKEVQKDQTLNQTLASFEEHMEMLIGKHEGAGCESGGVVYHNGEYLQDHCYPKTCNNGAIAVYLNHTTDNPCAPPFQPLTTGCYYYNSTRVTWCEARKQCWQMGGDLAMGPNLETLEAYVTLKGGNRVWVGVRDDLWLTGQLPNSLEWNSGRPHSDEYECGTLLDKTLADYPCTHSYRFVCQLY